MKDIEERISNTALFFSGIGTVGRRALAFCEELGFPVIGMRYAAVKDENGWDRNTQQLHELRTQYTAKPLTVLAAPGRNLQERINGLNEAGFNCPGSIEELPEIALAFDASNVPERNMIEIYKPRNIPFALNGGAAKLKLGLPFFAGIPGSILETNTAAFRKDAIIVSCNTHATATHLGALSKALGPERMEGLKHNNIVFMRRKYDPHKQEQPVFASLEATPYHLDEIAALIPEMQGKMSSLKGAFPTEYFHIVYMESEFYAPVKEELVEKYREILYENPRVISVKGNGLDQKKAYNAAAWSHIPDADLIHAISVVPHQREPNKIGTIIMTAQRGIVVPSHADYALLRTGIITNLDDAIQYTNTHGRWRGQTLTNIVNGVQYNMNHYDDMKKLHGEVDVKGGS